MKKNLAKPYILYVAEVIYLAISEIKSKEQNISNIDAMERFMGSPLYEKISSGKYHDCLLYTSPSPRDVLRSRMPSSA